MKLSLLQIFCAGLIVMCTCCTSDDVVNQMSDTPRYALYPIRQIEQAIDEGLVARDDIAELQEQADQLLSAPNYSVMQKQHTPPSGDMHDYYSIGIYWWPDSTTADGTPYIRKDGVKNPEYSEFDGPAISKMSGLVFKLSLAYSYTQNEEYARKAVDQLQAWFLSSETKMNPHLEYGQAIPGIVEGRGIGIIETANLLKVVNALPFLEASESLTNDIRNGLTDWFRDYNTWLLTSQKGWDERRWHNNHGSSYDSQVATFALLTENDSVARMILDSVKIKRIDRQIEPDGSQPWELERTKSMTYSIKNLDHLVENAILADNIGMDLWNYASKDGRSIKNAVKFLIPYIMDDKEWPYEQLGGIEKTKHRFYDLLWICSKHIDDPLIAESVTALQDNGYFPSHINLLYP